MRFSVPQFIDVEDKIFGPLTFRQFVYLAGGAGLCYLVLHFLPTIVALFLDIPLAGLALALAFYKVNNKPFLDLIESALNFFLRDKLYIWRKEKEAKKAAAAKAEPVRTRAIPILSQSKLHDISWGLDVLENRARQ